MIMNWGDHGFLPQNEFANRHDIGGGNVASENQPYARTIQVLGRMRASKT